MVIKLQGTGGALVLGSGEWCTVVFENASGRFELGTDSRSVVRQRLLDALTKDDGETAGEVDGVKVTWVASFLEKHGSLYLGPVQDGFRLFVEGADASMLGSLDLSDAQRDDWIRALSES